jgi:hypothetical protein
MTRERFVEPRPPYRPIRLLRISEPFDHPDWLYEATFDDFHALAHVNGHRCHAENRSPWRNPPPLMVQRINVQRFSGNGVLSRNLHAHCVTVFGESTCGAELLLHGKHAGSDTASRHFDAPKFVTRSC